MQITHTISEATHFYVSLFIVVLQHGLRAFDCFILQNAAYDSVREALISRNINLGKLRVLLSEGIFTFIDIFTKLLTLSVCPELGLSE